MSDLDLNFTYFKTSRNEPDILGLLIKIEHIVTTNGGEFKAKWNDGETIQEVNVHIALPNEDLKNVIDDLLDNIEHMLDEDIKEQYKKEQDRLEQDQKEYGDNDDGWDDKVDNDEEEDKEEDEEDWKGSVDGYEAFDKSPLDKLSTTKSDDDKESSWEPDRDGLKSSLEDSDSSQEQLGESQKKSLKKREIKRKQGKENGKESQSHQLMKKDKRTNDQGRKSEECDSVSNKDAEGSEEKKSTVPGTQGRRKISCPMPSCSASVVHLPRHMKTVHKWTEEASKKVLVRYNIRKRKSLKAGGKVTKKKKDYHRRRRCPVDKCQSIVFRLPAHLTKVHKMKKTSATYRKMLSEASYVPNRVHPLIRWGREMKNKKEKSGTLSDAAELGETSGEHMATTSSHEGSNQSNGMSSDDELSQLTSESSDDFFEGDNILFQQLEQDVDTDPVLQLFENWLLSPDGGKKDEKTAKQHHSQLACILNVIDKTADLKSLLDIKLIRTEFVKNHMEAMKYEAATIKSYLMSLRHFFSFLLADEPSQLSFDPQSLRAARDKLHMWSSSYRRESCIRRWKKLEEDSQNLLTPADIRKFEKSEAARRAITLLGQFSEPSSREVTQATYTLVRDFLFAQIFTDNANRPGVLSHMNMTEYNSIKKEGEEWIISVLNHKTIHIHGPAYIVLNSKLKSWLSIFVNRMRCQVTSSKKGNVFLSWNGQHLESSQINKAIQSVFKKASLEIKVTSTSFRKAAVTTVHANNPELGNKLANLMAHDEATAKKYYLLSEKSKASVEASKKLRDLMRNNDTNTAKLGDDCGTSHGSSTSSEQQLLPKERKPWTPQELKKVRNAFKEEIQRQSIELDVVKGRIEMDPKLTGMSPKRVYDRLRKELRNDLTEIGSETGEVLPEDLESESLQQRVERMETEHSDGTAFKTCDEESSLGYIAPTENSSKLFLDTDINTMHTLFSDMIQNKSISKKEIERRCQSDASGKRLLTNSTVTQVMNRIKYERRMRRSSKE